MLEETNCVTKYQKLLRNTKTTIQKFDMLLFSPPPECMCNYTIFYATIYVLLNHFQCLVAVLETKMK